MDALAPQAPPASPEPGAITALLRTVLLCDLVNSTALVERLGDSAAAALLQRHDQLLQRQLAVHQGQLIDKADGVLALFARPVQALGFALHYQRGLRELGLGVGEILQARVGIHVGDVMTWTHSPAEVLAGAKPVEVEGLAKPVAARLMGLALPGQILLSGMAHTLAQRAQDELGELAARVQWRLHGRYRFKGVSLPLLVHEVGEAGLAPLRAPPSGDKAWREQPLWRRPPVLALELLVSVGLLTAGAWTLLRSTPAIAFAERDWVVLADFNNRTGDELYDEALDSALRIGLEQSRHVNVLSDLQLDLALRRMQRAGQRIDREIGAELALREGAKALLLPTVAEVGGRPRLSVEIIDPQSGITVYTRMADADGRGGVVAALDEVLGGLRGDLGESLASIESGRVPLEKATTADIEALRDYSLGMRARVTGDRPAAMAHYREAVRRDPGFAMAYLRMAFVRYTENNSGEALHYMTQALANRERLTEREAMLLDAGHGQFTRPEQGLAGYRQVFERYPDEYRAYYNYALYAVQDALRCGEALDVLGPSLTPRNPARARAYYELGVIHLCLDRLDDAIAAFRQSDALGNHNLRLEYAATHGARREYGLAAEVLTAPTAERQGELTVEERLMAASLAIDQGQWPQAEAALAMDLAAAPPLERWTAELVRLSLRSYAGDPALASDLRAFVARQRAALADANLLDQRHLVFQLLAAGWMAAHAGESALAADVLAAVGAQAEAGGYPANADMLLALRAEQALAAGQPAAAVALLERRAASEQAAYFLHAVLMRAHAAAGQWAPALAQAEWLGRHRGFAYADFGSLYAWQAANLLESNLAALAAARYAEALGRPAEAAQQQQAFAAAWPNAPALAAVARRRAALD